MKNKHNKSPYTTTHLQAHPKNKVRGGQISEKDVLQWQTYCIYLDDHNKPILTPNLLRIIVPKGPLMQKFSQHKQLKN